MKLLLAIILLLITTSCASLKEEANDNFEAAIVEPAERIGSVR